MSSTNSNPDSVLVTVIKSQGKHGFLDLVKEITRKKSLIPKDKCVTLLLPTESALNKLSLESKRKIEYIIKSHMLVGDVTFDKSNNTKHKTLTGFMDVMFLKNANGKILMKDNDGNEFSLVPVPNNKIPNNKYIKHVYKITTGYINPKIKQSNKVSKKSIKGGLNNNVNEQINHLRISIHNDMLSKFKSYLRNPDNCINPYGPAVAGLLQCMEVHKHETECKKAAMLMTNCSFGLFYILLQPFKTHGECLIPDEVIEKWGGMEYYPEDICKFFCKFVETHAPEIYNNEELFTQINNKRAEFKLTNDYNEWLISAYESIKYDNKDLMLPIDKYYYDELKCKLCNIFCNIMHNRRDFEDVLFYNLSILELTFPCNDAMDESKFLKPAYKEFLRRDELLAPGSIYKFIYSTDFLGLFFNPQMVQNFQNVTADPEEINLNNKKVFNSESYRCEYLVKDVPKIKKVYTYNRALYC